MWRLKHFKRLLAVAFALVCVQLVIVTVTWRSQPAYGVYFDKLVYLVYNFVERFVRSAPSDDVVSLFSNARSSAWPNRTAVNPYCLKPYVEYNNSLALNFLQSDVKLMGKMLESCHEPEKYSLRDMLTLTSEPDRPIHWLQVHIDRVEEKFNVRRDAVRCVLERFDKPMNESEQIEEVVMVGDRVELDSNSFRIQLNSSGYFYLCCLNLGRLCLIHLIN